MNPIAKHYMRTRFKKRVEALKKAGFPVNQQTVYDELIEVGVPVPKFGKQKQTGRRQADHTESNLKFIIDFVVSGVHRLFATSLSPRSKSVFANHAAARPSAAPRKGASVDVEIPPKEAVFRADAVALGEDISMFGRAVFLALAALPLGISIYCQMQEDPSAMVKLIVWACFGSLGCWLTFLALWRRKVVIDLLHGRVILKSGVLVPLLTTKYRLRDYPDLKVETLRTTTMNTSRNSRHPQPAKVTKKYFLLGRGRLRIATRCYSSSDKERERMTWALENRLRSALHKCSRH